MVSGIVGRRHVEHQRRSLDEDGGLRIESLKGRACQPQRASHELIVQRPLFPQPIEHLLPDPAQRTPLELRVEVVGGLLQLIAQIVLARLDDLVRDLAAARDEDDEDLRGVEGDEVQMLERRVRRPRDGKRDLM